MKNYLYLLHLFDLLSKHSLHELSVLNINFIFNLKKTFQKFSTLSVQ